VAFTVRDAIFLAAFSTGLICFILGLLLGIFLGRLSKM
jgi:hypothetical protein